jgi:hypothetical protein
MLAPRLDHIHVVQHDVTDVAVRAQKLKVLEHHTRAFPARYRITAFNVFLGVAAFIRDAKAGGGEPPPALQGQTTC